MAHSAQTGRLFLFLIALAVVPVHGQIEDAGTLRQRGLESFRNGQIAAAIETYRRAIELDPGNEILYLEAADIFLVAGSPEEAEAMLGEAARRFPDSTSPAYNLLYHDLAEQWASSARLAKASGAMEAAARVKGPVSQALIYRRIGDFNSDLLRLDSALAAYEAALGLEPENMATLLALGNLRLRRNDLDEARQAFEGVLAEVPGSVDALHGIAEIRRRRGEFGFALAAADRVLERVPDHRGALYIRGTALVRLGRPDEGIQALREYQRFQAAAQAEERRLRDIHAFRTGGMDLMLGGRHAEAIELFEKGIRSYPEAAELHLSLGQAQGEAGRHLDAVATFERMLDEGIGDARVAHENLAREYRAVGDIEASNRHRALYEAEVNRDSGR